VNNLFSVWGVFCALIAFQGLVRAEESTTSFGPAWEHFPLSLKDGYRSEGLGPFFYDEHNEDSHVWAIPPFFSSVSSPGTDSAEIDFLYPIITYDRFGQEYRFQILQLFSLAGGGLQENQSKDRFTLFPIYFQQRSTVSNENYTALFPVFGKLRNRLFRDEIDFVLWPLYVKTKRRPGAGSVGADEFLSIGNRWAQSRRGDITTYNFIAPIFHLRYGDGLRGWQAWPLAGHELKMTTLRTNAWGDTETIPGFKKSFVLWPIWLQDYRNMGSTNESHYNALLPFYTSFRSPARDSTSYFWPFGLTLTEDRARKYDEVDFLWPVFAYARGEGKTTTRFWPLFGFSHNSFMERNFCAWPVYRYSRIHSDPLDRRRTQILFFLYSDKKELNTTTGNQSHRVDCWPLFTSKHDGRGNSSLQFLSLLEPVLAGSKSIERNYSHVWSIWRSEKSTSRGTSSKSLLWNLYSSRVTENGVHKTSFLFGLFQRKSSPNGSGLRLLYVPLSRIPEERGATVDSAAPLAQPAPGTGEKH
jgi:hypothetical protein